VAFFCFVLYPRANETLRQLRRMDNVIFFEIKKKINAKDFLVKWFFV